MPTIIIFIGLDMLLAALAIGFGQGLHWWFSGTWTPLAISDVWVATFGTQPEPLLKPQLVAKFVGWLLNQPLSVILLFVGGIMTWIGNRVDNGL